MSALTQQANAAPKRGRRGPRACAAQLLDQAVEELGELYEALVVSGRESLANALIVGATVEDLDIADLEIAIEGTDKPGLRQVYTNLPRGSEDHLRAFVAWLAQQDQTYTPQFISQARFDEIIGTQPSRGR